MQRKAVTSAPQSLRSHQVDRVASPCASSRRPLPNPSHPTRVQAGLVDYLKLLVYRQVCFTIACSLGNEMPKSQISLLVQRHVFKYPVLCIPHSPAWLLNIIVF